MTKITEINSFVGNNDGLMDGEWSPDGNKIESSSYSIIYIWNAITGSLIRTNYIKAGGVHSSVWSPIDNRIAFISDNYTLVGNIHYATHDLKIWNMTSDKYVNISFGRGDSCHGIAWSPDGTKIACNFYHNISIWDAKTGSILKTLPNYNGIIYSVAWSPDGSKIVSSLDDNTIRIWDANNGSVLRLLIGHNKTIVSVLWSPDNSKIISGSSDNTIKIWDVSTGINSLTINDRGVVSVALSPDGSKIASGSHSYQINLWNPITGANIKTFTSPDRDIYLNSEGFSLLQNQC